MDFSRSHNWEVLYVSVAIFVFCIEFDGNIHEKHRSESSRCSYLDGRDISIDFMPNVTKNGPQILGFPQHPNKEFLYRKVLNFEETLSLEKAPLGVYYLSNNFWKKRYTLPTLFAPQFVPRVEDCSMFLDVEVFFLQMRFEERRLFTFHSRLYPFTGGEQLAVDLAKNGFFFLSLEFNCAMFILSHHTFTYYF